MLFQPSNIYPSTLSGIGAGTVDVTQGLNVSWQVNGDTPMTAYQIKIYQNDTASTLKYDSGSVSVSPAFETHDRYGNPTFYTVLLSAATLSTAGIVNGYQYGYKMLITQWWGVSDYVEQTSASVFITRSLPTISIDAIPNPVTSSSLTITATYAQAQGDPISTVDWVFALAGSESNPIKNTGAVNTQVLSFDADGLINGNTYSIMCTVVTANGMEASTGFVQFTVSYSSSSLGINYQLAQLKNSSSVYLSWDDLGSNILSYPYTDTTKTTNGITFTVNGEGDVVVTGTATADAYFTIAQGTLSQLGITAGQKFIVTSGYSGAKIVVTETNSSNVVVSTITGNDPLQYIATSTTNTLKFSIVIPSGASFGTSQQLQPMIAIEDKIVALNDVSVTMQPIQDLHGYSAPWPAGGGKNKFGCADGVYAIGSTRTVEVANGVWAYKVNVHATSSTFLPVPAVSAMNIPKLAAGTYTFSLASNAIESAVVATATLNLSDGQAITNGNSFTVSTEASVVSITTQSIGEYELGTYTCYIQIESGTSATSWQPYSNICPISGRTGLSVYRTGVNVWDEQWELGSYNVNTGVPGASNSQIRCKNKIKVVPNTTYYIKATNTLWILEYDADDIYLNKYTFKMNQVFTTSANTQYIRFYALSTYGTTYNHDISINYPSTDHDYHAYNGNTYAIDWTSPAGTVYGGTLNVVTGELVVDRGRVNVSSSWYWYKSGSYSGGFYATIENAGTGQKTNTPFICSHAKTATSISQYVQGTCFCDGSINIRIMDGSDTVQDWKDYINAQITAGTPIQICYELATPLTYQLTPQEVATLVGQNNVWSTGDSASVTYTKDTGSQATLSGAIVTFSDSNAVLIPTPQYIPGITGISIYRYLQGESALQHVYDLATGATSILDYYAPSQMQVSYLIVAHSGIGDLFLQTTKFTPTFWFFSILLCDTDSNGDYHVSKEYIFKYGVETGAVSNNNDPTIQKNFTPYPNRQPISTLYKTGKISGYIGKTNNLNRYSDTISLQNAIYEISTSTLTKFIKTRKGDILMVDTASSIQMQTEDNTVEQALKATIDWVEVGDAEQVSIVSISTDQFWPLP